MDKDRAGQTPAYPSTIEDAVEWVIAHLTEEQKAALSAQPEEHLFMNVGFSFGMWIRNSLGLWSGNEALLASCGRSHPDDASAVIIRAVRERIRSLR